MLIIFPAFLTLMCFIMFLIMSIQDNGLSKAALSWGAGMILLVFWMILSTNSPCENINVRYKMHLVENKIIVNTNDGDILNVHKILPQQIDIEKYDLLQTSETCEGFGLKNGTVKSYKLAEKE